MKATLVIPPFEQKTTYGGGVFNRGMLPPLGIGYIAACARDHGHQTAPPPIFKPRSAKFKVETPSLRLGYTGLGCVRF